MVLSICVPTYNRSNELKKFFSSITLEYSDLIEVVICDDGSTDDTKELVEGFADSFKIKYIYQENQGRSTALKNSILNSSGRYCILMDSDDYFTCDGIKKILNGISEIEPGGNNEELKSLLFGVVLINKNTKVKNLPPDGVSNFLAVRADLKIKKDLKEVVCASLLKDCIYEVPEGCRRVPTSLLWAKVAEKTNCLCISEAVATKEYLPGGMTDRILYLKTKYTGPMVELYSLLSESKQYKSKLFRFRSRVLWARHAIHQGAISPNKFWQFLVLPLGFGIYLSDKFKLARSK